MSTRRAPSIRRKILSRTILVSMVPLLLLGGAALGSLLGLQRSVDDAIAETNQALTDEFGGVALSQDAAALAEQLEQYTGERVDDLVGWSDAPVVQDAGTGGDSAEAERFLRGAVGGPDSPYLAVALVDANSETVISVAGAVPSDPNGPWIQHALENGGSLGAVEPHDDVPYLNLAVRVEAADGTTLGALWVALDASFFQTFANDFRVDKDPSLQVSIFDRTSALLAETATDNASFRLYDADVERSETEQNFLDHGLSFQPGSADPEAGEHEAADPEAGEHEAADPEAGDPEAAEADAAGHEAAGHDPIDSDTVNSEAGDPDGGGATGQTHVSDFNEQFAAHGYVAEVSSSLRPDLVLGTDWITQVEEPSFVVLGPLEAVDQIPASLDSSVRSVFLALAAAVLVALLTAFFVGRVLARNIVRPITRLRDEADEVAGERLPNAVATIAEGGTPSPTEPIILDVHDEVGELADSFNEVQRTAIDLAADQANLRRSFSDLFVYLGRRNQNLLGRQLELIDDLERDEDDSELLGSLFDIDHLATRMRRNAESLLVIAGRETTRTWTEPVAIRDVVRAASSEVEDYTRVRLGQFADVHLRGEAVSDIAHLLAELVENALRYSPPNSVVTVCGQPYQGDAYAISISDQGLGLDAADLTAINRDLQAAASADDPDRVPTSSLGLFVVGRLAHRHGCEVRLTSEGEGTVAWVLLPPRLLATPTPTTPTPEPTAVEPESAAPEPAANEARPVPGRVISPPVTPDQAQPTTMAEALTLQPSGPDDPAPRVEPPVQPVVDGNGGGETPASRTASGFTRRVSRSRRSEPSAEPADAPRDPSPAPPRSAEEVGNSLRNFQAAVEQGRNAAPPAAGDGTERDSDHEGEGR